MFDRPGAYIHEQAVFFYENFGGPAFRPRARRSGTCLRGIAPGSCCFFDGPAAHSRSISIVCRGTDSTRIPCMFILSFLFEFLIPRLQFHSSRQSSPSFLVLDRPGAYIHERAVFFSENFGEPALLPRARRHRACLRGIAPGLRRDRAGSLAARRRAPVLSLARGGLRTYSQHVFPYFSV